VNGCRSFAVMSDRLKDSLDILVFSLLMFWRELRVLAYFEVFDPPYIKEGCFYVSEFKRCMMCIDHGSMVFHGCFLMSKSVEGYA